MARVVVLLVVPALLLAGCVTKKVKRALKEETRVSITVKGDDPALAALKDGLARFEDAKTTCEMIEKGVMIIRIVAAYAELMEALNWLVVQGVKLIANDEVTKSLLAAALK